MGVQPFGGGQFLNDRAQAAQAFPGEGLNLPPRPEVLHSQRAAAPGQAAGGQHVVAAGGVVARRLRRPAPHVHRTGVDDAGRVFLRAGGHHRGVFGSVAVGEPDGLFQGFGDEHFPMFGQGGAQNVPPGERGQQHGYFGFHPGREAGVGGYQNGRGVGAVFGLAQQVDGR